MATFRLQPGPIPLHHQVYLDLRGAIDSGEWPPGDRLPSERELARRYGCSLITVRRALTELAREHRIERSRGRGTFVTERPVELDLGGSLSFTEEMQRLGLDPETRLVDAGREAAGERVAEALELPAGAPTLYIERLRIAGGAPLLLEKVHLPAERFPGLLDADLERGSLYDLLTQTYGSRLARTREWLEPVVLPVREARLLGERSNGLALLIESIVYDEVGSPVEYGRSLVRGDRTRASFERVVERTLLAAVPMGS